MACNATAYAILGLANINWNLVQIAKNIDANLIGEGPNCFFPETKVDRHSSPH